MNFKEILVKKHVNKTCLTCIADTNTQLLRYCMSHTVWLLNYRNFQFYCQWTIENGQEQPDNWTEQILWWTGNNDFFIVLTFELTIYSDCVYEIGLYGIGSVWKRHSWLISDIAWTWFRPFTCISDSWNDPRDHFKVPRLIPWYFERTWHTDLYQFH